MRRRKPRKFYVTVQAKAVGNLTAHIIWSNLGGAGSVDALVSSLSFVSTSGGTQTNIPHRFVAGFNKGDVPTGYKLVLKNAGVAVTTQYDQTNTWSDGSIRTCVFRAFISSLGAAATWKWDIYKRPGTYSASAARTTADITAHDFKTVLSDVRNSSATVQGSGIYNCSVNTNIAVSGRTKKIATGPNCDVWTTWGKATDNTGGAEHSFITEKDCIEVWTDPTSSSTVYAISHAGKIQSGWRNVASPDSHTFTVKRKDGVTTLLSLDGAYAFVAGNIDTVNDTIDGSSIQTGQCVFLTAGTLPGASANTPYWAVRASTGKITLYKSSYAAWNLYATDKVNITATSSGTLTIYFDQVYHTGKHVRDIDTKEEWTAHEPLIIPAWTAAERTYIAKAGHLPAFDFTATPTSSTTCDYYPGSLCWPAGGTDGNIRPDIDGVGDHAMLYGLGNAASVALQKMATVDIRVATVLGYCASHLTQLWLDETLSGGQEVYTCLTLDNGSDDAGTAFSGMGTPLGNTGYCSPGTGNFVSCTSWSGLGSPPAGLTYLLQEGPTFWTTGDHSHQPQMAYVAYLLTGDPLLLDDLYSAANDIMWMPNVADSHRTRTVGATTYYGSFAHSYQSRSDGYAARDAIYAAICAPDGTGENLYFKKIVNDTLAYHVAYRASVDATYANGGHWLRAATECNVGGFMMSWLAVAYANLDRLWRTSNSVTMSAHFMLFEKHKYDSFLVTTGYRGNPYGIGCKATTAGTVWKAASAMGWSGGTLSASFGASNTVTDTSNLINDTTVACANGDKVWFNDHDPASTLPPELSYGTEYPILNLNVGGAGKFQLNNGSGSPIAFTSGFTAVIVYKGSSDSATGFIGGSGDYARKTTAALTCAQAYGYAGYSTGAAALRQRLADDGNGLSFDPVFNFSATVL